MLWTAVVGIMALKSFFHQDIPSRGHTGDEWNILAIFIIGALYFWHLALRIKYVSLDGKDLVIADYGKAIRVPLKDVERVWDNSGMRFSRNAWVVKFDTRLPTDFGSKIEFMPTLYMGYGQHPVVQELTDLVREAKGFEP